MKTEARREVLRIAQKAYADKLMAGTSGNISIRDEESGLIWITPSGLDYETMEEQDIVAIDREGSVMEGHRRPSSEWRMHMEIYRALTHVNAVVHTHSPYATCFAALHRSIPSILVETEIFLKGSIEVASYARQGSAEVGISCIPLLRTKNACLLANHGAVAVGETPVQAYHNCVYLEDTARVYHLAVCTGGEPFALKNGGII